jgi:hypothetical protein
MEALRERAERTSIVTSQVRSPRTAPTIAAVIGVMAVTAWLAGARTSPAQQPPPPGAQKSTTTRVLETGAGLVQANAPVEQLQIHLVGFHPMKDDPSHQMEAHHYCRQVNEDFAQCALFDGDGADANLNGIEYIVSEKIFDGLPADEKAYWHPHDYEILSGQLVAPGIPEAAERRLMAGKMNSYGKTWHVWHSGVAGQPGDALPLGPPMLAWSFNRDGEARSELLAARDERLGLDMQKDRARRQELVAAAKPQCGVDALAGRFPGPTTPIPGVVAKTEGCGTSSASGPARADAASPSRAGEPAPPGKVAP